ncbi:ead/Ea22-like family protein [Escherichia coli]|uniref:Ead/Ea22-like family protein n=1 Tax=Escherichia coli TaxID=562 RepID=A0A8H9T713_ECOLX|nr:ead/Ea22-like family protein [Escherichia coli]EBX8856280.1 ead/Ea22-like family protein [Salmonella enterica subsp. enterica serovar Mbandaka]UWF84969.1 MAG: Ead/Ea22-like protein [Bacteriophage sp.]HDQ6618831.1 ead/Ea22-like family protein [Escherichia coli O128:H2]HDQ6941894.1 ead/Ea22-like family protein [Escherichia coli O38:H26]EEC8515617.1 ead/Ea22-like family protein [Escherichia coli]
MSKIDYQALREAAEKATWGDWDSYKPHRGARGYEVRLSSQAIAQHVLKNNAEFIAAFNPKVALALLDERERNQQYIKRRDQENEDIALTVGKLLIENGQLVADTLRHLADNEIDSDYFAITSTNENGTEIDHEMAITDYALQAAGTVDELVAALESAEKRIAELSASHSKLRDTMAGIHNTIRMDGGYTPLAAILNAAKRAYEESASAAGIRIKGGE